jgi:hypothetical protein
MDACVATGYGLDNPEIESTLCRPKPTLEPSEPPIQWITDAHSSGIKRQEWEAAPYLQLVPRSRKRGSVHPLPPYVLMA